MERRSFTSYGLWAALDSARFAISRFREPELSRFGLTVEQSSILRVLAGLGLPVQARDLELATLRQHHSISTLVNRMMRVGLVAKDRSAGEKGYRISITDSGKSLIAGITTAAIDVTFGVLSERDKKRMTADLRRLYVRARDLLGLPLMPSREAVVSSG